MSVVPADVSAWRKALRKTLIERRQAVDATTLESTLKTIAVELGLKAGPLVHPLRVSLTGKGSGPSLYHLMEVLGRERSLARLDAQIARL